MKTFSLNNTQHRPLRLLTAALMLIGLLLQPGVLHPVKADSTVLLVDTQEDFYDPGTDPETFCDDGPQDCSLRQAIIKANADHTNDYLITFDPDVFPSAPAVEYIFPLSLTGTGEEVSKSGDLDIGKIPVPDGSPMDVTINLTIERNQNGGPIVIDGNQTDRIFQVMSKANLTLIGLKLTGGLATNNENGGAILNEGNLTLSNCTLSNNHVSERFTETGGLGGAVYTAENTNITINSSTVFENNFTGQGIGVPGGDGGALYVSTDATASILNASFKNNHTGTSTSNYSGSGGALFNNGNISLTNVDFDSNYTANGYTSSNATAGSSGIGGAVFNNFQGTLRFNGGNFTNNSTGNGGTSDIGHQGGNSGRGGAVHNVGAITQLLEITFSNNHTGSGGEGGIGGNSGNGGAISNEGSLSDLNNGALTFRLIQNRTGDGGRGQNGMGGDAGSGGGFFNNSSGFVNSPIITISAEGNAAGSGGKSETSHGGKGGSGGAISNFGSMAVSGKPSIDRSRFYNNLAGKGGIGGVNSNEGGGNGGDGGAIFNGRYIALIQDTTIDANAAGDGGNAGPSGLYSGKGGSGGGIFNDGDLSEIRYSTISNNQAGSGGNGNPSYNMSGGDGGNGGGIANANSSNARITVTNSTIVSNQAGMGGNGRPYGKGGVGGGIYNRGASFRLELSTLYDNHTLYYSSGTTKLENASEGAGIAHDSTNFSNRPVVIGSIIAGNYRELKNGTHLHSDCYNVNPASTVRSDGYNLIESVRAPIDATYGDNLACKSFYVKNAGDPPDIAGDYLLNGKTIPAVNPHLGDLNVNGGYYTLTLLPDKDSSTARDLIPLSKCSATRDQRGDPRPKGYYCDAGSVEFGEGNLIFLPLVRR